MADERMRGRGEDRRRKDGRAERDSGSFADPAEQDPGSFASPARISLLYESKDGRLCIFEDGEGHLTAVRASSLA